VQLVETFQQQALACEQLGSPLYADLLRRLVDDYELAGVSSKVLAGREDDPGPSALALRLLGSVHRLVLAGEAPELATFYPSAGGEWDLVLGWEAFEQVLRSRGAELRVLLAQPPQTNEVGRAVRDLPDLLPGVGKDGEALLLGPSREEGRVLDLERFGHLWAGRWRWRRVLGQSCDQAACDLLVVLGRQGGDQRLQALLFGFQVAGLAGAQARAGDPVRLVELVKLHPCLPSWPRIAHSEVPEQNDS
jgi:uncharacterized protein DUF2332